MNAKQNTYIIAKALHDTARDAYMTDSAKLAEPTTDDLDGPEWAAYDDADDALFMAHNLFALSTAKMDAENDLIDWAVEQGRDMLTANVEFDANIPDLDTLVAKAKRRIPMRRRLVDLALRLAA